jgi:hypothetical protein
MAKQERPIGTCDGCGDEREIIEVKNHWCDDCRKAVSRYLQLHPEEDPVTFLEARRRAARQRPFDRHSAMVDKAKNRLLTAHGHLIKAMTMASLSTQQTRAVKRVFQPNFEPIKGLRARQRHDWETFWKLPQKGTKPTEQQALAGKAGSMRTAGEEVQVD